MLGPLVLNKFAHSPEIPKVINGPPERNASYLNEINSSMRVSFCVSFGVFLFCLGAGEEPLPTCKNSGEERKVRRSCLHRKKPVIDSVWFWAPVFPFQGISRFPSAKGQRFGLGGSRANGPRSSDCHLVDHTSE